MQTLLSHLSIPGVGTYTDFLPPPLVHPGDYEVADFEATDYHVTEHTTTSPIVIGTETKLLEPLVFERALPDDFDGTPGVKRISAALSNLPPTKLPPPRHMLGLTATGSLWAVENESLIETQTGIITEIDAGPDRLTLTIEEDAAAPLQALIPKRLVRDLFPSADFSGLSVSGDPTPILPWGTMYKVGLPLCQRPYIHTEFQMVASGDSACYVNLTYVPPYLVEVGDVLEYDIHWLLPGSQVGFDVATAGGVTLRDSGATDTNGISSHPIADLDAVALEHWYRRAIPLATLAGQTLTYYTIGCEADTTRPSSADFSNIRIVNSQGELRLTIFDEVTTFSASVLVNVPPSNVVGIYKSDTYDYGPFVGTPIIHVAYRGSAVIPASQYVLTSPLLGLTTIRFTAPQRDTNGELAPISATLSAERFGRNPAIVKQFLLSDATDGVGVAVDAVSFGDAAFVLEAAGIRVDGGLSTQRSAIDVMRDLTFYGEALGVNDAGLYTDQADNAALHTLSLLHMGEGDGVWENVSFAPASFRLLDQLKQLTIKADLVQDFGGSETYAVSSGRLQAVAGSTVTHEEPYLSPQSVDRETYYRFTRNAQASLYRATVQAKSLELLPVTVNDLVVLHCPVDPDLDGRTMLVTQRQMSAESLSFTLRGHDAALYSYVGQPVQMTGVPPLIDYRFTLPATPTNFIVWVQAPTITSDGSIMNYLTVRADAPASNVTELKFRALRAGSVLFTEVPQRVIAGQTTYEAVFALEPGLTYHFECFSYNANNAAEYRYSVGAQILNWTADGDMTQPAAGVGVVLTQAGAKTVQIECVFSAPPDWGTVLLYRNMVNDTASAVLIGQGKKTIFHDNAIAYNVTYFYWFKVGDNTFVANGNPANLSAFSVGGSISIVRLVTDDYTDDSISTGKMQNLSVTSAKIGNLAVTTAKIDNLAVTNAKIETIVASKIQGETLRVNGAGNGASEIMVDAPAAIRLETDPADPARIIFQEGATGFEQARISGKGGSIAISPTTDDSGIVLEVGEAGLRWSSIGFRSANRISLTPGASNSVFISGRLGTSALESSVPPGATPNRRLPIYNSVNALIGYIWVSI